MGSCMQLLTLETSNNQRLRRCARRRSKVKPLLLHGCGLHKFHVTDVQNTPNLLQVIEGPNARDKIALSAFHLFLVCDLQATYMRRMRNNNLEIRIAGSSCRPQ